MATITYRTATEVDLGQVAEVQVASQRDLYARMYPHAARPRPVARDWPAWLANRPPFARPGRPKRIELALQAAQVVGFAAVRHGSNFTGFDSDLTGLYVLPAHQGRGIGQTLLARIVAWLGDAGIDGLAIDVVAANPACEFYERLGGRVIAKWFDDEPCVTYGLPLAGLRAAPPVAQTRSR